jgi:glycogen synthase
MIKNSLQTDFSLEHAAKNYLGLYEELLHS